MAGLNSTFLRDAAERVAVTAVEAAIAVLVVDLQDGEIAIDGIKVAVIAGVAAGLAAAKAALARWFGDRNNASLVTLPTTPVYPVRPPEAG